MTGNTITVTTGGQISIRLGGAKGDTGSQGVQGIQGVQGVQGVQGNQGIQGIQGDPGVNDANWTYEIPTGTKNGTNKSFTLAHAPVFIPLVFWGSAGGAAAMLYGTDFTYSGTTLTTITFAPDTADYFFVYYLY